MIFNLSAGGGSTIAYKFQTSQPTGSKNLIWFKTSTQASYVYFTASFPTSPTAGDVYVFENEHSHVTVDIGNGNTVELLYLGEAYQYNGSSWVHIEGYIYQGNTWVQFSGAIVSFIQVTTTDSFTSLTATNGTESHSNYTSLGNNVYELEVFNTGTWTVTMTDGTQTATRSVVIDGDNQIKQITITYFAATVIAVFPAACSSVTLTNGTDSQSVPSGDIANGTYTFTVASTGTYTLNAVFGGYTLDGTSSGVGKTATITTLGQSETITVNVLWLFRDPEQFSDVTGGWETVNSYYYCPVNTIDFTAFPSITWIDRNMSNPSYSQNIIYINATRGTNTGAVAQKSASSISQSNPVTIDLTAITGSYYVDLRRDVNSSITSWGKVYVSAI